MTSILSQLSSLISNSAQKIQDVCDAQGLEFPSLDSPFTPESERIRNNRIVAQASSELLAAAYHLIALVRPPPLTIAASATSVR